jgi:hypothetical protein
VRVPGAHSRGDPVDADDLQYLDRRHGKFPVGGAEAAGTTANQERELREIADRIGCEIVRSTKTTASAAPRAATSARPSTRCAVTLRGGTSKPARCIGAKKHLVLGLSHSYPVG